MFIANANLRKSLGMGRLMAPDTGADGGTGANDENGEEERASNEDKSFDDILKDKKYLSEFDKRINEALDTAKVKWQADYEAKLEEAKTEAQKLAKMNANQKTEYEQQKKLKEIEKREKEVTTRELQATAKSTLADKELPIELYEILNYESAETCNKSLEAVEKAFRSAVSKEVNEKLRGGKPPKTNISKSTSSSDGFISTIKKYQSKR